MLKDRMLSNNMASVEELKVGNTFTCNMKGKKMTKSSVVILSSANINNKEYV